MSVEKVSRVACSFRRKIFAMIVPSADILGVLAPLVGELTGRRDLRAQDVEELKKQVRFMQR
jgi:hypothetical protein